jgi:trk system potassium uptake protein TrkA
VSDIQEFAGGQARLFGMNVEIDSWLAGKTLEDLQRAGPPRDSLIAMIFRGQQVIIPHGAQVLLPGDHIYICATADNLEEVLAFMGIRRQDKVQRAFIVGGKQISIGVALALEKQGIQVKLIERETQRCEKIAQIVSKTVVVHGDGTDQSTLEEENIEGVDVFLALTSHDEDNIIASLLARRLGAKKVVALINRLNYLPMVQRLGVNTSVSMRLATVDRVLQFVRKGAVLSVTTFREEEAEAIEILAEEGSRYVGKRLRDMKFPRGAIVGAIAKPDGTVIIPRGDKTIEAGDRVIFFTLESVVPELESAFITAKRRKGVA